MKSNYAHWLKEVCSILKVANDTLEEPLMEFHKDHCPNQSNIEKQGHTYATDEIRTTLDNFHILLNKASQVLPNISEYQQWHDLFHPPFPTLETPYTRMDRSGLWNKTMVSTF